MGIIAHFFFFVFAFYVRIIYNNMVGDIMFNFEELKSLSEMQKQIVYCL